MSNLFKHSHILQQLKYKYFHELIIEEPIEIYNEVNEALKTLSLSDELNESFNTEYNPVFTKEKNNIEINKNCYDNIIIVSESSSSIDNSILEKNLKILDENNNQEMYINPDLL